MWLVSLLILLPIFFLIGGGTLPEPARNWIESVVQDDTMPSTQVVAVSFLIGAGISATPLHLFGRYLATLVHELGHAFTAGVLGGRPQQIKINLDTSGLFIPHQPGNWGRIRNSLVFVSGYFAPSVASLAAIKATQIGYPRSWFAYSVATLAIAIVFLVRNIWGFVWTFTAAAGSVAAAKYLPVEWIAASVPGFAGYLGIEGFRDCRIQQKNVKLVPGTWCDAEGLSQLWGIKARTAAGLQTLFVVAVSGYAAYLAIAPFDSEIISWFDDIVGSRLRDRLSL